MELQHPLYIRLLISERGVSSLELATKMLLSVVHVARASPIDVQQSEVILPVTRDVGIMLASFDSPEYDEGDVFICQYSLSQAAKTKVAEPAKSELCMG